MQVYRRKKNKLRKKFILFWIIFLLVILVSGILLSPLFRVRAINVYGNKEIETQNIEKSIGRTNVLLITGRGLENKLLKEFPKIAEIKIEKNVFKKTLTITLKEREKTGIICKAEKINGAETVKDCFYFDKNGIVFENAPQTSGALMLLIKDFSSTQLALGNKILEPELIGSMIEIKNNFPQAGNGIAWFELSMLPPKEIKAVTIKSWYILFDATRDMIKQFLILKTALSEKITNTDNLEYIDLRIENRIYYK